MATTQMPIEGVFNRETGQLVGISDEMKEIPVATYDAQNRLVGPSGPVLDVGAAQGLLLRDGIYNLKPTNMRRWRRVKAGGLDGIVLNIGDSTTRGQAGGTAPASTKAGEHAGSYPVKLKAMLGVAGLPVSQANFCGGGAYTVAQLPVADPRILMPADWTMNVPSIGGTSLAAPSPVTSALEFTPTEQFDRIDLYYIGAGASGTVAVSVDGGAALDTFATTNATPGLYKRTINCTLGTHTLKVARTTGGTVYVVAAILRNSTTPTIQIINAGWQGTRAVHWGVATDPWSAVNAIQVIDPDLTLINIGINDVGNATSMTSYMADMTATIAAARAGGGDAVLVKFVEADNSSRPLATQRLYWDALKSLADTLDCPLVMVADRIGPWANASADGFMYDALHPTAAGYADFARLIANALISA